MKISKEARQVSRELFRQSFVDGRLDEGRVRAMVDAVVVKKPRAQLAILKNFLRLVKLELERHHALVESAQALSPDDASAITRDLRIRHGRDLSTDFKVNPELLGGLRIQIGSDVWDGSVRNRLRRLEEHFTLS